MQKKATRRWGEKMTRRLGIRDNGCPKMAVFTLVTLVGKKEPDILESFNIIHINQCVASMVGVAWIESKAGGMQEVGVQELVASCHNIITKYHIVITLYSHNELE